MVGVPGRSKGCNSCRKRKIKCDGQKPFCKRCTSTGRQCEGYGKYPTFMIWTQDGYQPRSRLDDMKPAAAAVAPTEFTSNEGSTTASTTSADTATIRTSSPAVSWTSYIASCFMASICSSHDFYKDDVGTLWLTEGFSIPHGSRTLQLALDALACVRVAWFQSDEDLLRHGKHLYGLALESLQKDLYDLKLAVDEYTFVAARAMVMYEHYVSTTSDPSSWSSHVEGLSMILKNRGPQPFKTLCGRAALEDVRDTVMIKSYMDRKRSFLLDPAWMSLPWVGACKDLRQKVCDIGFRIAALFEEFDQAVPDASRDLPPASTVVAMFEQGLDCLNALDSLDLEHAHATGNTPELPFISVQSAIASLHAWALKIALRQLLDPILKILQNDSSALHGHLVAGDVHFVRGKLSDHSCLIVCRNINAAARFLSKDNLSYAASRRLAFPLLSAIYHLKSVESPELDGCKNLYAEFSRTKGVAIAKQLGKGVSHRFDTVNVRGSTGIATG